MVRSPPSSTSTTTLPVRPPRWTHALTPASSTSASRRLPRGSSPTRPRKRTRPAPSRAAAAVATLAALPPRRRLIAQGVSVASLIAVLGWTATSSRRSPSVASTPAAVAGGSAVASTPRLLAVAAASPVASMPVVGGGGQPTGRRTADFRASWKSLGSMRRTTEAFGSLPCLRQTSSTVCPLAGPSPVMTST